MPAPARDDWSLSRPRAVVFDFGDTLLREGPTDFLAGAGAVLALAREPVRCTAAELATALAELMADLDPRRRSAQIEIPPAAVRRLVYEPLGITFDRSTDDLEWAFWSAATSWSPEPGVLGALAALEAAGIPCAVLSNSMFSAATVTRQLEACGITAPFRFVMTSSEFVVRKPHRRLFQLAAARLGEDPAGIWFVGDSIDYDVAGAAEAGLVPLWYAAQSPAASCDRAAGVIRHWSEFAALLAPS